MTDRRPPNGRGVRGWLRGMRARSYLWTAAAAAVALYLLLPAGWPWSTRTLMAWDAGVVVYLALVGRLMATTDVPGMRARAHRYEYDEARWTILLLTIAAAAASGWAIVAELAGPVTALGRSLSVGLAIATVLLSWTLAHTMFAVHYAHEYYGPHESGTRGGLMLPGGGEPDYGDFLYTAFVIGCGAQTGDVEFTSRAMRRLALIQGVVAFVFNTAILALAVNIAASLVGIGGGAGG